MKMLVFFSSTYH